MASILIVDDQPSIRVLLKGILSRSGHALYFAENGVEALDALEQHAVDLLITDINMPQMDGLELLNRLQDRPNLSKLAMSAQRPQDIEPKLEALGVTDFFEKPLDIKRLRQRVETLLAQHRPSKT